MCCCASYSRKMNKSFVDWFEFPGLVQGSTWDFQQWKGRAKAKHVGNSASHGLQFTAFKGL